ncbi:MAG: T9SS type A sorting domain-containing protein [Bacteroidia bacterium]|nr:T9SS type A sorting domain-containing protein [Bacteroidia bacterium]
MTLAAHYGNVFEIDHAPLIADFDNNDTLEVFVVGGHAEYPDFQNDYGRAYMLSAGIGSDPPWLMFQHDIRRQSSLCEASAVSVPEHSVRNLNQLTIYPNPCSGLLTIQFDNNIKQFVSVKITDILGKEVYYESMSVTGFKNIDISGLGNGIYFIEATYSGKIYNGKILLKK